MCFAAIFIKSAHAPGIVTAFYRMFIGAAALLPMFLFHFFKNKPSLPLKGVLLAIAGGICFGIDMSLWSTGVVASNATIPTLFANTAPIWVGIGSVVIFKEKHGFKFWTGLSLTLAGMIILVKNDLIVSNGIIKGALLGLGAGVFYGIFYMVAQAGRKLIDTLSFMFINTFSSLTLLLAFTQIFGYDLTGYDAFTYKIFLAFGLGIQVVGWLFINYSQGYIPASIVAPTLLGQPLLTAFLAVIILKEELTFWHILGGIVTVSGIYIVHFSQKKQKSK